MKPKTKSMTWTLALAAVLSLLAARPCAADVPNPTPIDLGVLPLLSHAYSEAHAINASGQVVGISYNGDSPFELPVIWQNGGITQLPLPSGSQRGFATAINASGQVAGSCFVDAGLQACVWTPEGSGWTVTELGAPTYTHPDDQGFSLTFTSSYACKINDAGQVLARAYETTYDLTVAAIWQSGIWTVLTKSDGFPVGISWLPCKMNENGQVLLEVENSDDEEWSDLWLWDNGTASLLVKRIDWANLNNSGQVVGMCYEASNGQNYNFTYETSTKTFKFSPISEADYSLVNINDSGQVVVAYPTVDQWDIYGTYIGTTELGVTSFEGWSPGASVTSLGSVNGDVDNVSLNFNANDEVSGRGYSAGSAFYASIAAGVVLLNGLVQDDPYLEVTAMNDSGMIIGRSSGHAVLWGALTAYSWSGVLPPLNTDGTSVFKAGATVPVKFMLTGASAGITDLVATLSYTLISSGVVGAINETISTSAATTGNLFRYDSTAGQYIFNWSTKGLTRGTYQLFIDLGDGVEHTVDVGLR